MAKKTENRVLVTLTCSECKKPNYRVSKNTKNTADKLVLNKYCPECRKTTEHKETKTK
ncbi:MAG: 50S ribosomal protein L33 [Bacilli bacterium]|nr:50S ribosomal protein L33 [Bacilli bacterium]